MFIKSCELSSNPWTAFAFLLRVERNFKELRNENSIGVKIMVHNSNGVNNAKYFKIQFN